MQVLQLLDCIWHMQPCADMSQVHLHLGQPLAAGEGEGSIAVQLTGVCEPSARETCSGPWGTGTCGQSQMFHDSQQLQYPSYEPNSLAHVLLQCAGFCSSSERSPILLLRGFLLQDPNLAESRAQINCRGPTRSIHSGSWCGEACRSMAK